MEFLLLEEVKRLGMLDMQVEEEGWVDCRKGFRGVMRWE